MADSEDEKRAVPTDDSAAGSTPAAPRVRMVPAGTHFAKGADGRERAVNRAALEATGGFRPAGKRFSTPEPQAHVTPPVPVSPGHGAKDEHGDKAVHRAGDMRVPAARLHAERAAGAPGSGVRENGVHGGVREVAEVAAREANRPAGGHFASASPSTNGGHMHATATAGHFAAPASGASERPVQPVTPADETAVFLAMAQQRGETDKLKPLAEVTERLEEGSRQMASPLLEATDRLASEEGTPVAPSSSSENASPSSTAVFMCAARAGASQQRTAATSSSAQRANATGPALGPSRSAGGTPNHVAANRIISDSPAAGRHGSPRDAAHPAGHADACDAANPARRVSPRRIVSVALIVIGIILLVVAGFIFVRAQLGYREARDAYGSMQDAAIASVQSTVGDGVPNVDFDALAAVSEDIVGWIYIPNTEVNYPVVQGDTNDEYLRHLPDGTYNMNGSIFMDSADTAPGMIDQQTTLYGHHMNDNSMFRVIDNTLDQQVFDTVEHVYYITRDATYVLRPLFTAQVDETYVDAARPVFDDEDAFRSYLHGMLDQAKAKAADAEDRVDSTSNVMTLITCAGEIIPRTTRAAMVLSVDEIVARN